MSEEGIWNGMSDRRMLSRRPFYLILYKIARDRREVLKKAFFNIISLYRCSKWCEREGRKKKVDESG